MYIHDLLLVALYILYISKRYENFSMKTFEQL